MPTYRPIFTLEQVQDCARLVQQQNAPRVQVARAKLALLLHTRPALDSVTAARYCGQHPNWVYLAGTLRDWGLALTDRSGCGRKPAFSPSPGRNRPGAGL